MKLISISDLYVPRPDADFPPIHGTATFDDGYSCPFRLNHRPADKGRPAVSLYKKSSNRFRETWIVNPNPMISRVDAILADLTHEKREGLIEDAAAKENGAEVDREHRLGVAKLFWRKELAGPVLFDILKRMLEQDFSERDIGEGRRLIASIETLAPLPRFHVHDADDEGKRLSNFDREDYSAEIAAERYAAHNSRHTRPGEGGATRYYLPAEVVGRQAEEVR